MTLGTFNNNFMSPTRNAAPWEVSMLMRTSFLGEGFPEEIVSHTSKPSTGFGCEGSKLPPADKEVKFDDLKLFTL